MRGIFMNNREILICYTIKYEGNYRKIMQAICAKEEPEEIYYQRFKKHVKCKVLTMLDPEYPEYLKEMTYAPFVLFYYGDISLIKDYRKNVAIVGSRNASQAGLLNIYELAEEVSKTYNVVSGLAMGVDAAAHRGAIEGGGKTIAILGCGIEQCYPAINKSLYDEIKENHLLISEYYNYIPPYPEHFHQRNRLIVAFSKGTLIGESHCHSGTQMTANLTLDMHRQLMALPSSDLKDSLCNLFLQEGCPLVLSADDILYYLKG